MVMPQMEPLIRQWCGVIDGSSVLDVGCGSGFFSRILVSGEEDVTVTGIDLDPVLIDYAIHETEGNPHISFIRGNALSLPFDDSSFDAVTSHTFITSVTDPDIAIKEMLRVLKPGGILSCVVAMNFENSGASAGNYPKECVWHREFTLLNRKLWLAYEMVDPAMDYAKGLDPVQTPGFFHRHGLLDICAYPIGKLFSFSNAALSIETRLRWLDLYQRSEEERLKACMEFTDLPGFFSPDEASRYLELLGEKCSWLKDHVGENAIWEWHGGANMLIRGTKP